MNQSTLSWSATSNGVNSKSGRYFINFSFEAVCTVRMQVSILGFYLEATFTLPEQSRRLRQHCFKDARKTDLLVLSVRLAAVPLHVRFRTGPILAFHSEWNAATKPKERTVTSPSNPTALVIASATCLIVISSFSPTVRAQRLRQHLF